MNERRLFMKSGLVAMAGTVGLATTSGGAYGVAEKKWGMIIDLNRCCGCQSCVIACKAQNGTAPGSFNTKVLTLEDGTYPDARIAFTPVQCNQCEDPPCVPACPVDATFKLSNGVVVTDWDRCEGIGTCVTACPYDARFIDERHQGTEGGKVDKCDFCLHLLEQGLVPACVETCDSNARLFGDMNAPEGEFADYLKKADLTPRQAGLGIKTSILYLRNRRSHQGGLS